VKYDYARAKCALGSYAGLPTQTVLMYYMLNGAKQEPQVVHKYTWEQREGVAVDAVIPKIPKGDLAIWFVCSSRAQTTYDSDYSKNFNFKIQ
jgi:hypothetical protein